MVMTTARAPYAPDVCPTVINVHHLSVMFNLGAVGDCRYNIRSHNNGLALPLSLSNWFAIFPSC